MGDNGESELGSDHPPSLGRQLQSITGRDPSANSEPLRAAVTPARSTAGWASFLARQAPTLIVFSLILAGIGWMASHSATEEGGVANASESTADGTLISSLPTLQPDLIYGNWRYPIYSCKDQFTHFDPYGWGDYVDPQPETRPRIIAPVFKLILTSYSRFGDVILLNIAPINGRAFGALSAWGIIDQNHIISRQIIKENGEEYDLEHDPVPGISTIKIGQTEGSSLERCGTEADQRFKALASETQEAQQNYAVAEKKQLAFPGRPHIHDTSSNICESWEGIIEEAVSMGEQGVPIDTALSMADQALDTDGNLYSVMRETITLAYRNPSLIIKGLHDKSWVDACAEGVRGH